MQGVEHRGQGRRQHDPLRLGRHLRAGEQPRDEVAGVAVRQAEQGEGRANHLARPRQFEHLDDLFAGPVEAPKGLAGQELAGVPLLEVRAAGFDEAAPEVEFRQVAAGHVEQPVAGGLQVDHRVAGGAGTGRLRRRAEGEQLVQQGDAVLRAQARRVPTDFRGQVRHGHARDRRDFAALAARQPAEDFLPEVFGERVGVPVAHLRQDDDDRLAGADHVVQKLRRHRVVVPLVGRDVDDHVGQADDLHEPADVPGRGPRRHVRAVPNDEVAERVRGRLRRDAADLVHVLVEVGRLDLAEPSQRAEEAERRRPGRAEGGG